MTILNIRVLQVVRPAVNMVYCYLSWISKIKSKDCCLDNLFD